MSIYKHPLLLVTLCMLPIVFSVHAQQNVRELKKIEQSLSKQQKAELQKRVKALAVLSEEQRMAALHRMAEWDAQPYADKNKQREAINSWQQLSPQLQTKAELAAQRYDQLSPEQQQKLRQAYDQMDSMEKKGWLLDERLAVIYLKLHSLLAYAPEDEANAFLNAVRTLSPQALIDLTMLSQRLPPQDRDKFRRDLLNIPAAKRAAWLREEVQR